MNYLIQDRTEASLFHFFEEISAIPRSSGNEQAIADYLVDFAKHRGLSVFRDSANNVLIRIDASADCSTAPAVIMQGHMDMVFITDEDHKAHTEDTPIRLQYDGKWISAEGTSLGADNGVAVAAMLALADDPPASHPPLELLFTASEEIGLIGAKAFDCSLLQGKRFINLDGEENGIAIIGCAGGRKIELKKEISFAPIPPTAGLRLKLSGLQGGHSGAQIHLPLGNALKHMGELLQKLRERFCFTICSIDGGTVDNAIPSHCEVLLCPEHPQELSPLLAYTHTLADEAILAWKQTDPEVFLEMSREELCRVPAEKALDFFDEFSENAPHGVVAYSVTNPDTVSDSRNFAKVQTEDNTLTLTFSVRSFSDLRKEGLCQAIEALAKRYGFSTSYHGDYPGWDPRLPSPLLERYLEVCRELWGIEGYYHPIHAGLECGVFSQAIPALDAISIGCQMRDIHSPDEKLNADSFGKLYHLLRALLPKLR